MEQNIKEALEEQSKKIDAIYESVEKARKYFLFLIWITILSFAIPLIGVLVEAPKMIGAYTQALGGN